ncbi:MAG: hypothetical protein WBK46_10050 [Ruminococcus flavefaciens]
MKRRKILIVIALILLMALPIWFYCDARGKVIRINNFSESDILSINSAFNITASSSDKIESFEYRTYAAESFYVLSVKTDNKDAFISNNSAFEYVEELPSGFYILPNKRYIPKKKKTLYYTNDHVYVVVWSFEDNDIPKLFSELYDNQ